MSNLAEAFIVCVSVYWGIKCCIIYVREINMQHVVIFLYFQIETDDKKHTVGSEGQLIGLFKTHYPWLLKKLAIIIADTYL